MSDFQFPPPAGPAQFSPSTPAGRLPSTGPAHFGGPGAQQTASEAGFNPNYIYYVILKRLWMVLTIILVVPNATWLFTRRMPKEYQATTSLVVDIATPQYLGLQSRDMVDPYSATWWTSREFLETQLLILRSRSQAQSVAEKLCEQRIRRRDGDSGVPALEVLLPGARCDIPREDHHLGASADTIRVAAARLMKMVTIAVSKDSRVVLLTAVGHDRELVAMVANTFAKTYVDRNLSQRVEASGSAAGWLGSEFTSLQKQLYDAEEELVKFKADNNLMLVSLDDQQSDVVRRQHREAEELESVRLKLIALRPLRDLYSKVQTEDLENLSLPVADNEVIRNLKKQYVDILQRKVESAGKYLDKHPAVVAQEMGLNTIRAELRKEIGQVIKTAQIEYAMQEQQEQELRRAYKETTAEVMALQVRAVRYNQLKLNVDRLRRLAETVGGRETESGLAARLRTNNVHILDMGQVPLEPVGPNVEAAVLVSIAVSLVLAVVLAFLLELLDSTVKTQEDMERVMQIPFLGLIPHLPDEPVSPDDVPEKKDLYISRHPKSTVAECCRVIRTNLLFMSPDRPARTLLVTSAGPQEGKSMSSVSLALTMAQSGSRVLLVDTDMRRPRLHKVFGMPSGGVGLTAVIAGTVPTLEAVRTTEQENLFLLPCGPMPPNPAELLQTDRFRQVVKELAGAFDRVVFDSPPIGAVTDALVLSQVTDGVILVAKSHKTSREALRRTHRQLQDLNAQMLGCVLNDLDLENRRKGYGYQYYYYRSGYYRYGYGYYTSEPEQQAGAKPEAKEKKPDWSELDDLDDRKDGDAGGPAA